jgi:hypothetical protein
VLKARQQAARQISQLSAPGRPQWKPQTGYLSASPV